MPSQQLPSQVRAECKHLSLADPSFDTPAPVDLLLGADIFPQIWNNDNIQLGPGLPSAYSSQSLEIFPQSLAVTLSTSIESLMERFWNIEEPAAAPLDFTEDGQCETIFNSEMYRNYAGQYFVPLPFRSDSSDRLFPGMHEVALRRFYQLERKLLRDPILHNAYRAFIREYEELGHMSRSEESGDYFIPHHAIHKLVGDELKLRVVFDASAKCQAGYSLNDRLYVGPKLQQEIIDVLTGFKVKEYTLHTVTCGVNYAPYLALRVLQHIADNECDDFPAVQQTLRYQTYMDDICAGAESIVAAKILRNNLIEVLARAGLSLKKWSSNCVDLLDDLLDKDCACNPLAFDRGDGIHVLGMEWIPDTDCFTYDISAIKWSSEYLSTLQARGCWLKSQENVKLGAMVVLKDNSLPPLKWRLGRISELLPGSDGVVRVVRVLTKQGVIVRPVVKLVLLPTN
ncbi:uncharacterized protein LOC126910449 [Daktulosphaira vitifoliae]|uniref:uncharacterized protein LOC126910449 n=1 Tax=Daktulosphaira vitifoliae TaxID=58002 RepID=UPI0021A9C17C|nr:uncharacterized protein LOC126910449 [Daktulosphaira vitifoliae]